MEIPGFRDRRRGRGGWLGTTGIRIDSRFSVRWRTERFETAGYNFRTMRELTAD